jgi:hypothetical protein
MRRSKPNPDYTARQQGRSAPSDRASESRGCSQGTATRALTESTVILDASGAEAAAGLMKCGICGSSFRRSEDWPRCADNGSQILTLPVVQKL